MVVISGIVQAIKIGIRYAPAVYKGSKIVYTGLIKTRAGAQWLSRHPNIVKYGTVAAGAGGLLLDLTSIDYNALIPKTIPGTTKTGQTRDSMVSTSRRPRNKYVYCSPRTRRTFSRQKYRY